MKTGRNRSRKRKSRRQGSATVSSPFDLFLRDAGRFPLLTADAERGLSARARKGDTVALGDLVASNLRLAVVEARRYVHWRLLPLEELVAVACVGLMRAARMFNPDYGTRFSTYAVRAMRSVLSRAVLEYHQVGRVSDWIAKALVERRNAVRVAGRELSPAELAKSLKVSEKRARTVLAAKVFIDRPVLTLHPDMEIPDPTAGPVEVAESRDTIDSVSGLLDRLDKREAEVLRLRYGLGENRKPMLLDDVAAVWGVSKERVRQIQARAMRNLRKLAGVVDDSDSDSEG